MNEKITSSSSVRTPAEPAVLNDPLRNRGVAFTLAEREALGLTGRLPSGVLTLEEQAQRAVYTAAAGVDPRRVIPVSLDVGTNNEGLLNDPQYLGNRHARVRCAAYDAFIAKYLETASSMYPGALLRFEDFGASNARRILLSYRDRYRIFNDGADVRRVCRMSIVIPLNLSRPGTADVPAKS